MDDDWLYKLGEKILNYLPAIGGALLSLRYLPENVKLSFAIFSFFCSVGTAIVVGDYLIAHYQVTLSAAQNVILWACGVFGLLIINKLNALILQISYEDIKEFLISKLRKMIG